MAGTIYGLGLSQQVDENGEPRVGCLLYIYEAGTSTPVTIYSDSALSATQSNPLVADASGRIPAFWLENGDFRVRLTTSGGSELFNENSITAIGNSSNTNTTTVVSTDALATGDTMFSLKSTKSGWVRMNGRTIGNSASGATERANSDTEALYAFLWDNLADSEAAVSSGRGASAAADFAANKTIALPDLRGRAPFGLDSMGSTDSTRIGVDTAGGSAGASTYVIAEASLPAHTHGPGTLTVTTHTHDQGTLHADSHSHSEGTLVADSHTHSEGTLQADSHSHLSLIHI